MPLLDEQLLRTVRRRMVGEMAGDAGLGLAPDHVQRLSGTEPSRGLGCLLGAMIALSFRVAVRLVRRVFRTILFWLLLKDVAEEASRTFHEGYLLRRGLPALAKTREQLRALPHDAAQDGLALEQRAFADAITQLRSRVDGVCRDIDTRPFQRLVKESLGGSTRLLRSAGRRALRVLRLKRGASEAEREAAIEREVPESTVERLLRAISAESEYLRDLDRRWDAVSSTTIQ